MTENRNNKADVLLQQAKRYQSGRLTIFLGAAPGVGKTYAMLVRARDLLQQGQNIVIGYIETHGRIETESLLAGLPIIARKKIAYQGHTLEEMDLDAVLKSAAKMVLVDEFAHSNVPGSRHEKRWQDINELLDAGIDAVLRASSKPLLGICIGMQVLFEHSEEGGVAGLGLLRGKVRKLPATEGVRLPHMGWNRLEKRAASPLLDGIDGAAQAYFVHSYGVAGSGDAILETEHGGSFAAAVARGRIAGAQFHPERSGEVGARFLRNFLAWQPA